MKKCKFDIYIGIKIDYEQSDKIIATVIPQFFIPFGQNLDGSSRNIGKEYFFDLHKLGTYIIDWMDLLGENNISSEIFLNIKSVKKTFYGKEIIDVINALEKQENFKVLRNFNFVQEIK